jgi:uncharacterized protein with HEPN domain
MKPTVRRFDYFLQDMVNAMERILRYTANISYHEFTANDLIRDAVIRNFEIMGESSKHIPFGFQKQHKRIPWQRMFALRNFIVHEYFDVDDEIIWSITQTDLKANLEELKVILNSTDVQSFYRNHRNPPK